MTDSVLKDFDWKRLGMDAVSLYAAMGLLTESIPSVDEGMLKEAGIYGVAKYIYYLAKQKWWSDFATTGDYAGLWNYLATVAGTDLIYVYLLGWLTNIELTFKAALPEVLIAVPLGGFFNGDLTYKY